MLVRMIDFIRLYENLTRVSIPLRLIHNEGRVNFPVTKPDANVSLAWPDPRCESTFVVNPALQHLQICSAVI